MTERTDHRRAILLCETPEGHEIRQPVLGWAVKQQLKVLFKTACANEIPQKNTTKI